jgi:hypothetical protein
MSIEATCENEDVTLISCYQGSKAKMKSIVLDKAGNEYYCMFNKDDFKLFPDMRPVEIYDLKTMEIRKFVKKFLVIKEDLPVKEKKVQKFL